MPRGKKKIQRWNYNEVRLKELIVISLIDKKEEGLPGSINRMHRSRKPERKHDVFGDLERNEAKQ